MVFSKIFIWSFEIFKTSFQGDTYKMRLQRSTKIQNFVRTFWKRSRVFGWFDCSVFFVYGHKVNLSLKRWVWRWTFWMKPFPQYLHMCGFSSVWIFTCFLKVEAVVNADPQKSQMCFLGRSFERKNWLYASYTTWYW